MKLHSESHPVSCGTTFCFRRFRRAGWALFAALGRKVRIGVLSAAMVAAGSAVCTAQTSTHTADTPHLTDETGQPAGAVETEEAAADSLSVALQEASVVASRAPLAQAVAARPIVILSCDALTTAGVTCIADVLKLPSGVDVRQRGGFAVQTDIGLEGSTCEGVAILLNGVSLSCPQTGHHSADLPIALGDVERIEVIQGAAGRLVGSQSFAGAINIVTKSAPTPRNFDLSALVEGGSRGYVAAEARATAQVSPRYHSSMSLRAQRGDGFVENGDFQGVKAFWHSVYATSGARLTTQCAATVQDFGANTFYSAAYPTQWEALRRYLASVQGDFGRRLHLVPLFSWVRTTDHYQLVRRTSKGENFHRGDVFTAALNAWMPWEGGRTAVGAEIRHETMLSTSLGRPVETEEEVPVRHQEGISYGRRDARTNYSLFFEHNVVIRRFTLSAGLLAQRNTSLADGFSFYPGIDASFRPSRPWRLFASYNRSLRLPTFTDLYYKSPTLEGNRDLRPEQADAWRLGMEYIKKSVQLAAKFHASRGNNMIDWVMYDASDVFHATQFQLSTFGAGVSAQIHFPTLLSRSFFVENLSLDYAYLYQHRRDATPYFKSNYALEHLRHKFTARLVHHLLPVQQQPSRRGTLQAAWSLRVQERAGAYMEYENLKPTGALIPYGAHAVLDLKLTYVPDVFRQHLHFYLDLQNLTHHRYYDLAGVRQAGLIVLVGCRLTGL